MTGPATTLSHISGNRRMAAQRVAMRTIKGCLLLLFKADLSHEKIAYALQLSRGFVSKYIKVALGATLIPPPRSSIHAATACCPQ